MNPKRLLRQVARWEHHSQLAPLMVWLAYVDWFVPLRVFRVMSVMLSTAQTLREEQADIANRYTYRIGYLFWNGPTHCKRGYRPQLDLLNPDLPTHERKGYGFLYRRQRETGANRQFDSRIEKRCLCGGMAQKRYDGKGQVARQRAIRQARKSFRVV